MLDLKHNLPGPWQSEAINQVREELREVIPGELYICTTENHVCKIQDYFLVV